MLRRLIIALGALGLVLVVYGIYKGQNPPPARTVAPAPTITLTPATSSAPATQRTIPGIQALSIAPGKAEFKVFDPRKGELQYLLQWDEYIPSSEDGTEVHVVRPSLSKYMRDGQILQVTAAEGLIHPEPAGNNTFRPKRGTLTGDVEIRIDLTTRQWRAEHPGQEAMDSHPEHVIRIQMDSLYFDDDLSLIRTDGPVAVQSEKFDVNSKGLRLVYSRLQDRLEQLEILEGGTLIFRDAVDLESSSLLAGRQASAPKTLRDAPARTASATAPASQESTDDTDTDAIPTTQPRHIDVYQARFEGPIELRQWRNQQVVSRLDADKSLDLLFDMGPRNKGSADMANSPDKPLRGSTTSQPSSDVSDKVVLTWAGRLDITPIQRHSQEDGQRTTIIRAAGQRVVLADLENTIECNELEYDLIHRTGRIASTPPTMARVTEARGRYVSGHDIRFDQSGIMTGTLDIIGPGEAAETSTQPSISGADLKTTAEGPTRIQWHKGLSMRFVRRSLTAALSLRPLLPLQFPDKASAAMAMYQGVYEIPRPQDRMSLGAGPLKGLGARSALIRGNALVHRGEDSICAGRLEVSFYPAAGDGPVFGPIRTAKGTGGVSLSSQAGASDTESRSITSDALDVTFDMISADRSNPSHALAAGRAVVIQGTSRIEADRIDVNLTSTANAAEPATTQPGKSKTPRMSVSELVAVGNVRIADPKQSLNLTSGRLKASIDKNQTISQVEVDGSATQPASVATAQYVLVAPHLKGDLRAENVSVPSGGQLTLQRSQDFQGRPLAKAEPLTITWTDHMQMWGQKNLIEFAGHVQAIQTNPATNRKELDFKGDTMQVFLRPAAPQMAKIDTPPTAPQRLANLLDKAREQLAESFPAAQGWAAVQRPADRGRTISSGSREPLRIVAQGNAAATMPRYDETGTLLTSRLLIVGPTFVIDLDRQQMEVEGKGNLLVENYALAKMAAKLTTIENPATLPAIKSGSPDGGLSQTVFTWHNAMLFILPEREAVFDGQVNMIHLAGGKIRFGEELASALGAKMNLLKTLPGRQATLNCDNLRVQFAQIAGQEGGDQWMQRAKLENFIAEGKMVSLEEQLSNGGTNLITAGMLQYNGQRDTFVVQRSTGSPAQLVQQKDGSSISSTHAADTIYWERNSDKGPGHDRVVVRNARGTLFQ